MRREDVLIAAQDLVCLEAFIGKAPLLEDAELSRALAACDRSETRPERRQPRERGDVTLPRIQLRRAS